jgi:hypothetical protein
MNALCTQPTSQEMLQQLLFQKKLQKTPVRAIKARRVWSRGYMDMKGEIR